MPNVQIDNTILKQGELSIFYLKQDDITSNPTFQGLGVVDSLTEPLGDLNPIDIPDPSQPNAFVTVDVTRSAPDLGEISIIEYPQINRLSLAEKMKKQLCRWAFILKASNCGRKDVLTDWQSLFLVQGVQATELDYGTLSQFAENEADQFTTTANHLGVERVFPIRAEEKAASVVLAEVLDVIYADQLSCGTCAPYSDGCQMKFALTAANTGSVGLSGQIVFSKNGSTYNTDDINSLAGGNGTSLIAVGQYLIVTQAVGAQQHHYALKSAVTDTPNSYNWTAVSTGYNASGGGLCSAVGKSGRLFVGGQGGYVYASDNPTSSVTAITSADITTNDINAISYYQGNLLAVGASNTILLSTNADNDINAITFGSITGDSSLIGVDLTACKIWSSSTFEVGSANGKVFYTNDGGLTWYQRGLPITPTYINDIQYDDFVLIGAMAVQTATSGYILRTVDGGRNWYNSTPGISQLATAPEKYNAVALCGANAIFAGGKKASSTDGILIEAT